MRGVRRLTAVLAAGAAMLASATPAHAGPALPNSMASTGDSITRAYDSTWWGCFLTDCPQNSWSTGTASSVNSQYLRIKAQNAAITGNNFNDAKTGAKMADLAGQLSTAGSTQHVGYVTILMGANDVCTSSTSTMTSTADFQSQFSSALSGFIAADPGGLVYVSSLPNVVTLYNALQNNSSALSAWRNFNICQSALPPGGTDASRQLVHQREVAFNGILQSVCGQYPGNCLYDGGAGFAATYSASCISTIDYFHPNVTGEAFIAQLTWAKSYWGNGVYRSAC